jgi:IclR family acetate operon transcriptional repressor
VLDGDSVVYLQIVESAQAMRLAARRGERDYIHSTALGKAIAAQQSDEAVRALLRASGMPARTPRTITRIDDFMVERARVREQGYAIDDEENEQGARCVAVALPGTMSPPASASARPPSASPTSTRRPPQRRSPTRRAG